MELQAYYAPPLGLTTSDGINFYLQVFLTNKATYFRKWLCVAMLTLLDTKKDWGYVLFTNSDNDGNLGNDIWNYMEKEEY